MKPQVAASLKSAAAEAENLRQQGLYPSVQEAKANAGRVAAMESGPRMQIEYGLPKALILAQPSGTQQVGLEVHGSASVGRLSFGFQLTPNLAMNADAKEMALNLAGSLGAGPGLAEGQSYRLGGSFGFGFAFEHTETKSVSEIEGREHSRDLSGQVGIFEISSGKVTGIDTATGGDTYSGSQMRMSLSFPPSLGGGWTGSQAMSKNLLELKLDPPAASGAGSGE